MRAIILININTNSALNIIPLHAKGVKNEIFLGMGTNS